jgi:hypothetical protein
MEVVLVTARSTDTFTIERAQQGTSAAAFSAGATVELRVTADTLLRLQRGPELVLATGWSGSNFLQSASGNMNGNATMTVGTLVRLPRVQDEDGVTKVIISNGTLFTQGYGIQFDALRPAVQAAFDFSKFTTGSFSPDWSPGPVTSPGTFGFIDWKTCLLVERVDGNNVSIFLQMIEFRTITPAGVFTPGATGMIVGQAVDGTLPFTDGGLAGIAYADVAFTNAQIREWMLACIEANDVVTNSLAWDNLFSFKQMGLRHGDSVPSTVDDMIGSADLTLTGSLSIVEERPRWL